MCHSEDVYYTLTGLIQEDHIVPHVENMFSEGSKCFENYLAVHNACQRLNARLCVVCDTDVEIIINALLDNQRILCLKMYEYGQQDCRK